MIALDVEIMTFSVNTMSWNGDHHAFVVEKFVEYNNSEVTMQDSFQRHFVLGRHDPVLIEKQFIVGYPPSDKYIRL